MREKLRIKSIKPRAQITNYYEFHKEERRKVMGIKIFLKANFSKTKKFAFPD